MSGFDSLPGATAWQSSPIPYKYWDISVTGSGLIQGPIIPPNGLFVATDVEIVIPSPAAGAEILLSSQITGLFWFLFVVSGSGPQWTQWRGWQVFSGNDRINVSLGNVQCAIRISGLLYSSPIGPA